MNSEPIRKKPKIIIVKTKQEIFEAKLRAQQYRLTRKLAVVNYKLALLEVNKLNIVSIKKEII